MEFYFYADKKGGMAEKSFPFLNNFFTFVQMKNKGKTTRSSLQFRMTAFVTSAVIFVSAVAMFLVAVRVSRVYENLLQDRISDDLAAISRIMEQRLLRIEETTETVAAVASLRIDDWRATDSLLCRSLEAMDDVYGVSIIFDNSIVPRPDGVYERYASCKLNGEIELGDHINRWGEEDMTEWDICYGEGRPLWSDFVTEYTQGYKAISYFVPLQDKKDGRRIGVVYSVILENYLTSFVKRYKAQKDIDISIYKADGKMVVAPDDYILHLKPEELLVRESTIGHIGWKVVLSADRRVIGARVNKALLSMLVMLILMFIVIAVVIKLAVRYVARPFIEEQQRVEKERAVMENEMALAAGAQNELIPHVFPPFPERKGLDLAACLHPARKVGGDIYDYFIFGNKLYFCIGDVSGKGVQASLFMAATHYLFRSIATGASVAESARHMNVSLCTDNEQCRFVTFWFGCLDLGSGELEYVNAGHDSPILLRDGKAGFFPPSENMSLGISEEEEFVSNTVILQPGDLLLLYTDGVTEAMDEHNTEFGSGRLLEAVGNVSVTDAPGLVESILAAVRKHAGDAVQSDDITMLCLKFIMKETNQNQ